MALRSRSIFACLFFLLIALSANAEVAVNITYLDSAGEGFYDNTARSAVPGNDGATLGEQRRNAFEAAVYHWSKLLNGNVTVRIKATWTSQGTSTLASASPLGFFRDWNGVPVAGRFYPAALANQLAGYDFDPAEDDIQVMCNPDWDDGTNAGAGDTRKWYYGTDGEPPGNDFDFYSTMLHELGHGLGFISFLSTDGTWQNSAPTIYDNFFVNSSGTWVTSLSQVQRGAMVTSASLFSAGGSTTSANYGQWAKIHAPASYTPGSSLSHLDEATFSTTGHIDECMTPVASFATHNIGPVATALFRDMGYSFVDNQAPSVAITLPADGSSRSGLTLASGTATDTSSAGEAGASGIREVRVTLWRQAGGNWYNWATDTWGGTTYDASLHIKLAGASIVPIGKGTRSWAIALPTLAEGNYELQAQAVDQMNIGSTWVKSSFTVDRSAPGISFDPLQQNAVVFDLSQLGGPAVDVATVEFAIHDITDKPTRYWNGAGWVTSGNDYLPGSVSGGRWSPGATPLPRRSQLRLGSYQIYAKAHDSANNLTVTNITVTRSASDTTLPDVAVTTPASNQVFTARSLPVLSGTATDGESGIEAVTVYLMRFADEGISYWDGTAWNTTPNPISTTFDSASGVWQSTGTLPGGTNLPNGTYQVQVTAQNGENPPGLRGTGVNFIVDFHPTYTWTEGSFNDGFSGNDNRSFNNAANWNPIGVPTPDAIIVINHGECDASPMGSLSIYGANIGGGKLITPGMFVKKLNISSGVLKGGAVNIDGDGGVFNWTGGEIEGTLGILAGSVANVSGGSTKTLGSGAVLNNHGTVNFSGSGYIYNLGYNLSDLAVVNNHSNAVFNVLNDGSTFSSAYNRSRFNNLPGARFVKTGGAGQTSANGFNFHNAGEVRAQTGTIKFDTVLHSASGTRFVGPGGFLFNGTAFDASGAITVDGAVFKLESGTLTGGNNLVLATENNGAFEWTGGTIVGQVEVAADSRFNITGSSSKTFGSGAIFRNGGNISWSGSGEVYNVGYQMTDRATFRNLSGSSLVMTGTGRFSYSYNPSTFINESGATIVKPGNGSSGFDWVFNNAGSVQCDGGTLIMNNGGVHSGSFTTAAGSITKLGGGAHVLNDGVRWYGAGTYQITGGSMSLNGALQLGGSDGATIIELASATLKGEGSLTGGNAILNWTSGYVGGTLHFGTNVTVNVLGSSSKTFDAGAVINNGGVFNWDGSGELYAMALDLTNRVTFNNLSNAVFNIRSNAPMSASYNASIFNNFPGGTVAKIGGGGTTTFSWNFNSFGTVRSSSGTLSLEASGTNGGSFFAETNAAIRFNNGTYTLTNDTVWRGAGKIVISGGRVIHNGDVQVGTAELPTRIDITGGAFGGSGALLGVATVNWTGGTVGGGILHIPSTVTFNVSGSGTKEFGGQTVFNNAGMFNYTGTGSIYALAYEQTNRSVFNNLNGGVFNILNDGRIFETAYNASFFTNHSGGLIVKSAGSGTSQLSTFDFANAGEVRVQSGTVSFGSKLDLAPGSLFSGAGTVRLAGTTTLDGTLTSSSAVVFESGSFRGVTNGISTPTLAGSGSYTWTGGSISGALTIASNVVFSASGSSEKTIGSGSVLNNYGVVNWSGGNLYAMAYSAPADLVYVYNRAGAVWNLTSDAQMTYSYSPSIFVNEAGATFHKSGGSGLGGFQWEFRNAGAVEVSSGHLTLGASTVTMAPGASTKLWLGGTTPGLEYSQLARSSVFPFAGSLQVVLKDNYIPTNGSRFNLATYTSRSGQFAPVTLPSLPPESTWELTYGPTELVARVVAVTRLQNSVRLANGYFEFTAIGEPGGSVVIQTSPDLVTWQSISTNNSFNGTLTFTDPEAATFTNRFYRAIIVK